MKANNNIKFLNSLNEEQLKRIARNCFIIYKYSQVTVKKSENFITLKCQNEPIPVESGSSLIRDVVEFNINDFEILNMNYKYGFLEDLNKINSKLASYFVGKFGEEYSKAYLEYNSKKHNGELETL